MLLKDTLACTEEELGDQNTKLLIKPSPAVFIISVAGSNPLVSIWIKDWHFKSPMESLLSGYDVFPVGPGMIQNSILTVTSCFFRKAKSLHPIKNNEQKKCKKEVSCKKISALVLCLI